MGNEIDAITGLGFTLEMNHWLLAGMQSVVTADTLALTAKVRLDLDCECARF